MTYTLNKKIITEGILEHFKKNNAKYAAGAGAIVGAGAMKLALDDNSPETDPEPDDDLMTFGTKAALTAGGLGALAIAANHPGESKAIAKGSVEGAKKVVDGVSKASTAISSGLISAGKSTHESFKRNARNNIRQARRDYNKNK